MDGLWPVVSLLLLLASCCHARDFTFTFRLRAGKAECFYDYIHGGAFLEIEYQVIEGGDLDVNFVVSDPDKKPLVMEPHSMDGLHAIDIKKTGEYEICLDNSFSRLTDKVLFLDVIIEDDPGEEQEEQEVVPYELSKQAMFMDMKIENIKKRLDGIGGKLVKVVQTQTFFKVRESRHRRTAESNNRRVLRWSLLQCIVMISVGMVQVYVIRSLFKTRRKDRIRT